MAGLSRPDLAGQSFEIGSPDVLTAPDLARLVSGRVKQDVTFDPITPVEFGKRVGDAIGSTEAAFALGDLFGSMAQLSDADMAT